VEKGGESILSHAFLGGFFSGVIFNNGVAFDLLPGPFLDNPISPSYQTILSVSDFHTINAGDERIYEGTIAFGDPIKPIPEPATMLLLGSGLIGLVGFIRKFKKG
jgi:hypothetical protein